MAKLMASYCATAAREVCFLILSFGLTFVKFVNHKVRIATNFCICCGLTFEVVVVVLLSFVNKLSQRRICCGQFVGQPHLVPLLME